MPKSTPADNTVTFEEVPSDLRPAMAANYLRLLDEGFLPAHITFRRHGDVLRAHAVYPDGRAGTSRPANPRPAPAAEAAINPDTLDREQRTALTAQRKQELAALEGTRVRASWPGGHERIGVITRRDRYTFLLADMESLLLHPSDQLPALEPFTPRWTQPQPSTATATTAAA
jgi:hypothetical protein